MFFTIFGRTLAWLATVLEVIAVVAGYELGINQAESAGAEMLNFNASQWYGKQGKLFREQGFIMRFCGLISGVLCDISRSAARKGEE